MRSEIVVHLRVNRSEGVRHVLKKNRFAIYLKNMQTEKLIPIGDKPIGLLDEAHFESIYNGSRCLEDMGISQKTLQRNTVCKRIECATFEN